MINFVTYLLIYLFTDCHGDGELRCIFVKDHLLLSRPVAASVFASTIFRPISS